MLTNGSDREGGCNIEILIIIKTQAIGEEIGKAEYDVYLLAELWMRPDHATIAAALPEVTI